MILSVIIVSYNSKAILQTCLGYLKTRLKENFVAKETEIIVVDNNSIDGAKEWLDQQKDLRTAFLKENIGFGRANNVGLQLAQGEYILLLNSDVYLKQKIDFSELITFLKLDKLRAGLTVQVNLPNGKIDPASHRGFPTVWNALTYFSGLEKLSNQKTVKKYLGGLARRFGGYHLAHHDLNSIHEIDSPTAAFYLLKKKILKHLNGFDPDYFFYGEDLDLSYRIKELGYSIWYYPKYAVLHLKSKSGKKAKNEQIKSEAQRHFYETMLIFYQKHYQNKYPGLVNWVVKLGIRILKKADL